MTHHITPHRSTITITNLALRTIVGFNDWERTKKQDVVINIKMDFDSTKAVETDRVGDTLDYKKIKRSVITVVEESSFNLLEKLTHAVLEKIMENPRVLSAKVSLDKPHALRFTDSVSITMSAERGN